MPLEERAADAPECGYVEADKAYHGAAQQYRDAEQSGAKKSALEKLLGAIEAAEKRRESAAQCEDRAHTWSDLAAQQQGARAAISAAQTAQAQIIWTFVNTLALLATIAIGWRAIIEGRRISRAEIKESRRIGEAQVRCYLGISDVYMEIGGDTKTEEAFTAQGGAPTKPRDWLPKVFFTVTNKGQTPARRVFWVPSIRYVASIFPEKGDPSHIVRYGTRSFPMTEDRMKRTWGETIDSADRHPFSADIHEYLTDAELKAATQGNGGALGINVVISLCRTDVFDLVEVQDFSFAGGIIGLSKGNRIDLRPIPIGGFDKPEREVLVKNADGTLKRGQRAAQEED